MDTIDQLKEWLTLRIEEDFGLNSMYAVRIDGEFSKVDARSESGTKAHPRTRSRAWSRGRSERDYRQPRSRRFVRLNNYGNYNKLQYEEG